MHIGRTRRKAVAPAALGVLLAIASGCSRNQGVLPRGTLTIRTAEGPALLNVQIADTNEARVRGLMGRSRLDADAGMAFLWDQAARRSFWMKDTSIPLSIAFWDRGHVLAILDMQPCLADPCPGYLPGEAFIGAVEANLGYFASHHVAVGDAIELSR